MAILQLYLLGSPRLEHNGTVIEMDTRKALALLAYLAVNPQEHQRDELATLLYPDYDQSSARAAFRRTLSTLNSALGGGVLEIRREAVGMAAHSGMWVDLIEFHRQLADCTSHGHAASEVCPACLPLLREAAALYRDDFLAGFSLRDSSTFDDWQYIQRETYHRELASALDRLSLFLARTGDVEGAIEQARRWSNLDLLNEEAHRRLMKAYAWGGQRNAALRQYRECVRILEQELGVAPLEETTLLYKAIMGNQEIPQAVLAQSAQVTPPLDQAVIPPIMATHPERYPLVGRVTELEQLRRAYQRLSAGGCFFALEGEAGVGKTALAEEFLARIEAQGGVVFRFGCYAGENNLAYAPFIDGLQTALSRQDQASRADKISPVWLSEAARLVPGLSEQHPGLPVAPPLDGPGANAHFYEGVSQVLFNLCEGELPGVVFFDDLHWVDSSSLELLGYLVRRMHGHALFLLAAWRNEGSPVDQHLRQLVAEAARSGRSDNLRLDRLGESEVFELIRSRQPAPKPLQSSMIKRLYKEAEGLPFFVVEYLAMLSNRSEPLAGEVWEIPPSVRELLRSRLADLDDMSRQVLTAAAVIGRSFDFDTLHAASGRSEGECIASLETLTRLGLVGERAGGAPSELEYDFSHEKLQGLVYEEASLARRRLLHRRAAETLIARRQRQAGGPLAMQVARHAQLGGQEALAAEYYRRAGDYMGGLYANTEALAAYQSALALGYPQTADLYQEIGHLQTLMGDYAAAINSYEMAAALCKPGCAAELEYMLANVHHRRGEWDLADSHFQASYEQLGGEDGDPELLARLFADWSRTAHDQRRDGRALELAQRSLELAEKMGEKRALAQAHNILGILARNQGQREDAIRHLQFSLEIAQSLHDQGAQTAALNNLAKVYGDQHDWERAIEGVQTALDLCTQQGDRHRQAALLNHLADLYHEAGQPELAMENLKKAVVLFSEIGHKAETQQPEIWMLTEW